MSATATASVEVISRLSFSAELRQSRCEGRGSQSRADRRHDFVRPLALDWIQLNHRPVISGPQLDHAPTTGDIRVIPAPGVRPSVTEENYYGHTTLKDTKSTVLGSLIVDKVLVSRKPRRARPWRVDGQLGFLNRGEARVTGEDPRCREIGRAIYSEVCGSAHSGRTVWAVGWTYSQERFAAVPSDLEAIEKYLRRCGGTRKFRDAASSGEDKRTLLRLPTDAVKSKLDE